MGGFDFSLSFTDRQMNFVRTLLRSVQKWGRSHKVQFRYRKEGKGSFICLVYGSLISIQLLAALIATRLPVLVAVNGDPLTHAERSKVICKFIWNYNESAFVNFMTLLLIGQVGLVEPRIRSILITL
jgi:hypothetical protein